MKRRPRPPSGREPFKSFSIRVTPELHNEMLKYSKENESLGEFIRPLIAKEVKRRRDLHLEQVWSMSPEGIPEHVRKAYGLSEPEEGTESVEQAHHSDERK